MIVQKMGNNAKSTMRNLVPKETGESSHISFRKVVNLHAIEAKLKIAIIGVINGKTKINKINNAFNPKKNLSRSGITPTVLSIWSIVSENRFANKIKKNNHPILKTKGHNIFNIQKFSAGLSENHNLNSTKLKIRKIRMGTKIIEIKIISRERIIPLICLDLIWLHIYRKHLPNNNLKPFFLFWLIVFNY